MRPLANSPRYSPCLLLANSSRCSPVARGRHVLEIVGRHDQQVRLAGPVLRVARVEPDDGLERVVGRDVERQRLLRDQEQDALGARRRRQRARVLEERRGRQLRRQRGEV